VDALETAFCPTLPDIFLAQNPREFDTMVPLRFDLPEVQNLR